MNQILERSEVAGSEALVRYLHAIHEASHAVVGWATGHDAIHVTIIPKGFSRGRTRFDPLPAHLDLELPGNRALADRQAMIGLAGAIAERRCLGKRWRATPSPTDFTLMSSVAAQAIHSRVALESYLDRLARQVSVLLDLYWSQVEIVALALFEEGELTGKAVKKLISSSQ